MICKKKNIYFFLLSVPVMSLEHKPAEKVLLPFPAKNRRGKANPFPLRCCERLLSLWHNGKSKIYAFGARMRLETGAAQPGRFGNNFPVYVRGSSSFSSHSERITKSASGQVWLPSRSKRQV